MCCAAIWSAVTPPYGSWLMRGLTPESHVPGVIACVGPDACLFSRPLTIVSWLLNGASGSSSGDSSKLLPSAAGVQRFMIAPCGK